MSGVLVMSGLVRRNVESACSGCEATTAQGCAPSHYRNFHHSIKSFTFTALCSDVGKEQDIIRCLLCSSYLAR